MRELSAFENSLISHNLPVIEVEGTHEVSNTVQVDSSGNAASGDRAKPVLEKVDKEESPSTSSTASNPSVKATRPNVLFILADDLRPQLAHPGRA